MKTLFVALPALSLATPALSHGGMHLHPHGMDASLALVLGSIVVLAGLAAVKAIKVRK